MLYCSSYGHVETLAGATAEGAREIEGAEAVIKRVPELMPEGVARKAGVKLVSTHLTMLHQGMVIVGRPYSAKELTDLTEVRGGSPYGAATIAGPENDRIPNQKELSMARQQGRFVADVARKLAA